MNLIFAVVLQRSEKELQRKCPIHYLRLIFQAASIFLLSNKAALELKQDNSVDYVFSGGKKQNI